MDNHLSNAVVEQLFDCAVVVTCLPVADHSHALTSIESAVTAPMVPARLNTYSTGRAAARQSLAKLGIENFSLVAADTREPLWPPGIIGSLTHTDNDCVAVVAEQGECLGIGIDVEKLTDIGAGERNIILTAGEKTMLSRLTPSRYFDCAIFSIKEAIFKSVFPYNRQWIDFQQADVTLDVERGSYSVVFNEAVAPEGLSVSGRFVMLPDCVVSSATLSTL